MHESASFLSDLAIVLVVAALIGLLVRRLGQSTILGYLVAGLVVGPDIPIPVFADPERIESLSEFGVVLVMFVIGLELRLARLARVLPISGMTALVQIGALFWAGLTAGRLLGWNDVESVFLGAAIAISSTMVVSRLFDQQPVEAAVREHVFGVLVLQDVAAIAFIAALTAVAAGQGLSAAAFAVTVGELAAVLVGLMVAGLLVVPRLVRLAVRLEQPEVLVVVVAGVCFGFALLAEELGYSVALGAFVAGVLVAESGRGETVEQVVRPLKDLFAAVFFVSVGMTVDPRLVWEHAPTSLLIFLVVVVGQLLSVSIAGVFSGCGVRRSIRSGLALGQIGELGFVIVAIGVAGGVVQPGLRPIIVTVAVLTAFSTPLALAAADRIVHAADDMMPRRLQNLLVVYEAWFEKLRGQTDTGRSSRLRRIVVAITFDVVAVVGLAICTALWFAELTTLAATETGLPPRSASLAIVTLAGGLCLPLLLGLLRSTRALATLIADAIFEPGDTSGARRLFRLAIELSVMIGGGFPAAAAVRWFLGPPWASVTGLVLSALGAVHLWRTAGRMDREVRSGAEGLLHRLAAQSFPDEPPPVLTAEHLLPGLDRVYRVRLRPDDPAVGQTLAELDLRAQTGASIVAIRRPQEAVSIPTGHERLAAGDVLAIAGSEIAAHEARRILQGPSPDPRWEAAPESGP